MVTSDPTFTEKSKAGELVLPRYDGPVAITPVDKVHAFVGFDRTRTLVSYTADRRGIGSAHVLYVLEDLHVLSESTLHFHNVGPQKLITTVGSTRSNLPLQLATRVFCTANCKMGLCKRANHSPRGLFVLQTVRRVSPRGLSTSVSRIDLEVPRLGTPQHTRQPDQCGH